jgi:hypothetical protein
MTFDLFDYLCTLSWWQTPRLGGEVKNFIHDSENILSTVCTLLKVSDSTDIETNTIQSIKESGLVKGEGIL